MNGTAGQIASAAAPSPAPMPKNTAATISAHTADTTGNTSSDRSPRTTAQLCFVSAQPRPMRPMQRRPYRTTKAPGDRGPSHDFGFRDARLLVRAVLGRRVVRVAVAIQAQAQELHGADLAAVGQLQERRDRPELSARDGQVVVVGRHPVAGLATDRDLLERAVALDAADEHLVDADDGLALEVRAHEEGVRAVRGADELREVLARHAAGRARSVAARVARRGPR